MRADWDAQKLKKEKPVQQEPDLTLVEQACNGDTDSFTELCRRYYPAMVAIAHSVIGDRHLAEDAAQQTFARAVRRLPHLKNKTKFAGWLAVICRNVAKDMARTVGAGPRACPVTFGHTFFRLEVILALIHRSVDKLGHSVLLSKSTCSQSSAAPGSVPA